MPVVSFQSRAPGVHQFMSGEVQSLPDVRRPEARSAEIKSPDGVARSFHVSVNKLDPSESVLARNLLAKDDARSALFDEVKPRRPQVPLVSKSRSFACRAERLARTTARPDGSVVGPSCLSQGVRPDADSCEEVTLGVSPQIVWADVFNAPLIHISRRYMALFD
jgi:hypothetical protein